MYNGFFKQIDCETKAYWLGFIAADGNVRKDFLATSITLQREDRTHLEKFNSCFDNSLKISDYITTDNGCEVSRITVYSKQCGLDLQQYGIVPNKSLILSLNWSLIPQELVHHTIRGFFDGNGSIYCSRPKRASGYNYDEWGINFTGTESMLGFIKDFFHIPQKIHRCKTNCYCLEVTKLITVFDTMNKLYYNATIYLNRKKEKYQEFQSSQRLSKAVSRRHYDVEERELAIAIGALLGRASLRGNLICKTSKSLDMLEKARNIVNKYEYETSIVEISISGRKAWRLNIQLSEKEAKFIKHSFYPNDNKTVTRHLLNKLNCDAIYIWLLFNSHEIDGGRAIGSSGFTYDEHVIMQNYFKVVYGATATIRKQRDKFILYLTKQAVEILSTKSCVPRSIF